MKRKPANHNINNRPEVVVFVQRETSFVFSWCTLTVRYDGNVKA